MGGEHAANEQTAAVRRGSVAALQINISLMSAFARIADVLRQIFDQLSPTVCFHQEQSFDQVNFR